MFLDYYKNGYVVLKPYNIIKDKKRYRLRVQSPRIQYNEYKKCREYAKKYSKKNINVNIIRQFKDNLKNAFIYEDCIFCNNISNVFHHENYDIWNFGYFMCYSCHNKYHKGLKNV